MEEKKLLCTEVRTIAFDNQVVVMENEDIKVTLNIKKQWHFDMFQKGVEYPSLDLDLVKKELTEEAEASEAPAAETTAAPALTVSKPDAPAEKSLEDLQKQKAILEAEIAAKSQPVNGAVV